MKRIISNIHIKFRVKSPLGDLGAMMKVFLGISIIVILFSNVNIKAEPLRREYDEISVFLNVYRMGGSEVPAVIRGNEVYLPVVDVFNLLRIKADFTQGLDSVKGFFIDQKNNYIID